MLWSLTIVVLPFPTALVAGPHGAGGEAITKVLYVGTMATSSLVLGLVCVVIRGEDELRDSTEVPDIFAAFGTTATFVVALLVMVLVPAAGYWPLLLLAVPGRAISLGRGALERARPPA
jgi:hypothetical protein